MVTIVSGAGQGLRSFLHVLFEVTGRGVPWLGAHRRPGSVRDTQPPCSAARRDLGWQPTASLPEALRRTWHTLFVGQA
jgi:nucleoside-diphosphate-sugar epimerase